MALTGGTFFPLYETLYSQFKDELDKFPSESDIQNLKKNIETLDKSGKDLVFVWTRVHSLRTSGAKLLDAPYEGTTIETKICEDKEELKTIKFDLRKWPLALCKMIEKFCELHRSRMAEEEYRASLDLTGGNAIKNGKK